MLSTSGGARSGGAVRRTRRHGTGPRHSRRNGSLSPASFILGRKTLRRQTPDVGAGCLNWARPVLCGGRSAMSVPTAIILEWEQGMPRAEALLSRPNAALGLTERPRAEG